ncbi:MAG: BlaI/MecI/CopY family transcriptional regulator [Acidobacteria bacterium]|nr:BlaI/MecI/CopY family transcriptional regulator [Acidobacteriota bacterium]
MAKPKEVNLTKFELEIMEVLWDIGEASVREVQEKLHERKRPAYTTVQTIFARLEEKDAVRRTRKIGNAFLFEPLITRKSVYRRLIDQFLDLFGGSAEPVVARLVETGKLTLADLKAIEEQRAVASEPTEGSNRKRGRK